MSTTDIIQKNVIDLPALNGVDHRTWLELDRNSSSSYKESMDSMRYSWLNIPANMLTPTNGATRFDSLTRYSAIAFPDSTASGLPGAAATVYTSKILPNSNIFQIFYWTFTTAALSTLDARMLLTLDAPNGWGFDLASYSTASTDEPISIPGSSGIDTLQYSVDSVTNRDFFTPGGYSYFTIYLNRLSSNALDTLTIPINLVALQLRIGTTST
jgi:hypothetical protein